jgi:hypothetical protein
MGLSLSGAQSNPQDELTMMGVLAVLFLQLSIIYVCIATPLIGRRLTKTRADVTVVSFTHHHALWWTHTASSNNFVQKKLLV